MANSKITEVSKSLIANQMTATISKQQTKQLFVTTEIKECDDGEDSDEDVFGSNILENGVSDMPKAPPLPKVDIDWHSPGGAYACHTVATKARRPRGLDDSSRNHKPTPRNWQT